VQNFNTFSVKNIRTIFLLVLLFLVQLACDDLCELAEPKKAIEAGPRWAAVSRLLPTLCGGIFFFLLICL
jgi:hypothetical protein